MIERCRPGGSRSVAGRVAAILREVAIRPDRSVTEVARRVELPVSITHRLLGELVAARLVQRGPERRYRIGPAGGPIAATALKSGPSVATAREGVSGADSVAAV